MTRAAGIVPVSVADHPSSTCPSTIAPSRPRTPNSAPDVSAGASSENGCTGSHTAVPARFKARRSTVAVSARKSPAVLDMLLSKVACAWLCRAE